MHVPSICSRLHKENCFQALLLRSQWAVNVPGITNDSWTASFLTSDLNVRQGSLEREHMASSLLHQRG